MSVVSSHAAPLAPLNDPPRRAVWLRDLAILAKPGIVVMNTLMAAGGAALAPGRLPGLAFAALLAGTALVIAAAGAFNQYIERDLDGEMERTRNRPLPARRLPRSAALLFGGSLALAGLSVLALATRPITAELGLLGLLTYVLVYTPLKARSPLSVPMGAVAGALPPVMGYTAVTGGLDATAACLFAILFVWQLPHFYAIALFRRDDYAHAGVVTVVATIGERRTWHRIILLSALLLPVGASLRFVGAASWLYFTAVSAAGLLVLARALAGYCRYRTLRAAGAAGRDDAAARRFFRATLLYLTIVALALLIDGLLVLG